MKKIFIFLLLAGCNGGNFDCVCDGDIHVADLAGGGLLNETATGENPTVVPNYSDKDTGIGRDGIDKGALIAGGVMVADFRKTAAGGQLNFPPQNNAARPSLGFAVDSGLYESAPDVLSITLGATEALRFENPGDLASGETSLWLYDKQAGTLVQVTIGAADSAGAGFKILKIAN